MPEVLGNLVKEMKAIAPFFESLIKEADGKIATLSTQSLTGEVIAHLGWCWGAEAAGG